MGGFFGAASLNDCINDVFFGTDYHSHLCPNAEKYYNEVMSIPLYYGLTDDDVEDVIHAVKKVVAYYTKLK